MFKTYFHCLSEKIVNSGSDLEEEDDDAVGPKPFEPTAGGLTQKE